MKRFLAHAAVLTFALAATILVGRLDLSADEGMYPISEIHKLNLKKLGFAIDAKTLYNPDGVSLIDAIVNVGGCTGSFVSAEGLVITNHHCVFGAVSNASTKDQDYVTHGFLASDRSKEMPARGMTIRITESYRDVSKDVLSVVDNQMSAVDRATAIQKRMRDLAQEAEKANPGKQVSVSEMFAGRTYVLFQYAQIRDVRLVYVPQRSIGEFGGEDDNWVWPRHTGDFSFVRAYVAPDGSPAEYSTENVPYKPKKFLKVNPNGVDESDFVFILGYPGRTFRHQPSGFLRHDEDVRLGMIADFYEWQIRLLEQMGKEDRAVALKFDSRIKGMANVMKNYRGKLKGLARIQLVQKKVEEEKALQEFIDQSEVRRNVYGSTLNNLNAVYAEMSENAGREILMDLFGSTPTLFSRAAALYEASLERQKPDAERAAAYTDKNFERFQQNMMRSFASYHEPADRALMAELLRRASLLQGAQRITELDPWIGKDASMLDQMYQSTVLKDEKQMEGLLKATPDELRKLNDPFLNLVVALKPVQLAVRETRQKRTGIINKEYPLYVEVKEQFQKATFIPDANSTLRLTFGRIKGYSPADAVYFSPISTLSGVVQKTTGAPPFYDTPKKLLDQAKAKNYGKYAHKKLKDVPVGILYNTDTTGGNSGSPLMNARGELVGVNFDRAYEATINDYAWSDAYSRSIAVDIRYVLWVTKYVGEAGHILKEMNAE
ncbi:MAG: S46 family peptidase [Bacteroidota bacterium]